MKQRPKGFNIPCPRETCLPTLAYSSPQRFSSRTRGAAMSIPKAIKQRFHRGVYIVAVLTMPDMAWGQAIVDAAARHYVDVIFGTDRWVNQLVELAGGGETDAGAACPETGSTRQAKRQTGAGRACFETNLRLGFLSFA